MTCTVRILSICNNVTVSHRVHTSAPNCDHNLHIYVSRGHLEDSLVHDGRMSSLHYAVIPNDHVCNEQQGQRVVTLTDGVLTRFLHS